MITFENDYNHNAHAKIIARLAMSSNDFFPGYGVDDICEQAKNKIRAEINKADAEIYFAVGGTQTNQLVISTVLNPCEGIIAATTGHVNGHEGGAIEYSGHKVLTIPEHDGKITAGDLKKYIQSCLDDESYDHIVHPGMTYISYPTEYGTLYTKQELTDIYAVCKEYNIPLFIDGARLGYGLTSKACDLTMAELADLCDVFYIGGTKLGALCGEAIVFSNMKAPKFFFTQMKQHGAVLAKGWLLGLQFDEFFYDDLYYKIGEHANDMADQVRQILAEAGCKFFIETYTNQIFVVMANDMLEKLRKDMLLTAWEPYDDTHIVVRFVTSFSTTQEDVNKLREILL